MSDQTQESIFNDTEATTEESTVTVTDTQEPSTDTAYADLLATIKAEDGRQKYTDVETALKSLPHANEHIAKLQKEADELRQEVAKRAAAEEVLTKLEERVGSNADSTPAAELDLAKLEEIVDKRLMTQRQQEAMANNLKEVTSRLQETYGEKAEEVFYSAAKDVGLSQEQINQLAATAPQAVLKLLGGTNTSGMPTKTHSDVNTEVFNRGQPVTQGSAKVPVGATTKDMVTAWRNAKVN